MITRVTLAIVIAAVALVVSCDNLPTGPAATPGMIVRGVTLADWTRDGYASAAATAALSGIAGTGANTVVLIRTAYQASTRSNIVVDDPNRTPTVSSLRSAAAEVHALGMRVVIKPHVDVEGGAWRGEIRPDEPAAWFASYAAFLLETAVLARDAGAETFVVGTELAGTVEHESQWRALIGAVREVYGGEVVYAASWDGAGRVGFWGAVDRVGVDFYGAVAQRDDPGRVELLAGWQPWMERLEQLHHRAGKPIVITEIGYRSVDGAGRQPFAFDDNRPVDMEEQADLYWAALSALGDRSWVDGVYWWNWLVGNGDDDARDYTPRSKPAQGELTNAWTN